MRPGSIILNIARGGLIDEKALLGLLTAGHLAGAALDCFTKEPYDGPLKEMDNVILTPTSAPMPRKRGSSWKRTPSKTCSTSCSPEPKRMALSLIVFDCDGVILESVDAKTKAFGQVAEPLGRGSPRPAPPLPYPARRGEPPREIRMALPRSVPPGNHA